MVDEIFDFLKMNDVKYKKDVKLSKISTVKIGGIARIVSYPDSTDKLILLLKFLQKCEIDYKILGRISNILPADEGYQGVIIKTDLLRGVNCKDCYIEADAGVSLAVISKCALRGGLSGFEELSGIPGSLGGSIRGNAGAFGREISDLISFITAYDPFSGNVVALDPTELCFAHRDSSFRKNNWIILSARLRLVQSDVSSISTAMQKFKEIRRATQPIGEPSLGSVFKRPGEGLYAAKMIDECGLKGKSIGGAKISEKHAGFIVNSGGASARDYLSLVGYAQKYVYERFNITLEREIEIM